MVDKTNNQNDLVSEEILQALNFILEGSVDNMQTKLTFSEFIKQPVVQSKMVSLIAKQINTILKLKKLNPIFDRNTR